MQLQETTKTLKQILFVRHGQSTGNARHEDPLQIGDHNLKLTNLGQTQAREAGEIMGGKTLRNSLIYCSPYRRARETCQYALEAVGLKDKVRVYEDPRLREVEHGFEDVASQEAMRAIHGWFYYRFQGGESPADCYDRTSAALESIYRQVARKNAETVVIFSHGLTIRCAITRFLHLSVEDFESMSNPKNGAIITLDCVGTPEPPIFTQGKWKVHGISLR